MLDNSLAGKRLLLIGGIAPMTDLIELARLMKSMHWMWMPWQNFAGKSIMTV